jgi:hydrogenase maturation protease
MPDSASDILIIGCGNELRGDDGLGPCIARAIGERHWPGVRTLAVHQLTPELAPCIAASRLVVFIDAAVSGAEVSVTPVEAGPAEQAFTHQGSAAGLMMLAAALYGRCPSAWQVAVCGSDFHHGRSISAASEPRIGKALAAIERLTTQAPPAPRDPAARQPT